MEAFLRAKAARTLKKFHKFITEITQRITRHAALILFSVENETILSPTLRVATQLDRKNSLTMNWKEDYTIALLLCGAQPLRFVEVD